MEMLMHPVTQALVGLAALCVVTLTVFYINANSKSGCFLGYCGTVIKAPG